MSYLRRHNAVPWRAYLERTPYQRQGIQRALRSCYEYQSYDGNRALAIEAALLGSAQDRPRTIQEVYGKLERPQGFPQNTSWHQAIRRDYEQTRHLPQA